MSKRNILGIFIVVAIPIYFTMKTIKRNTNYPLVNWTSIKSHHEFCNKHEKAVFTIHFFFSHIYCFITCYIVRRLSQFNIYIYKYIYTRKLHYGYRCGLSILTHCVLLWCRLSTAQIRHTSFALLQMSDPICILVYIAPMWSAAVAVSLQIWSTSICCLQQLDCCCASPVCTPSQVSGALELWGVGTDWTNYSPC